MGPGPLQLKQESGLIMTEKNAAEAKRGQGQGGRGGKAHSAYMRELLLLRPGT